MADPPRVSLGKRFPRESIIDVPPVMRCASTITDEINQRRCYSLDRGTHTRPGACTHGEGVGLVLNLEDYNTPGNICWLHRSLRALGGYERQHTCISPLGMHINPFTEMTHNSRMARAGAAVQLGIANLDGLTDALPGA